MTSNQSLLTQLFADGGPFVFAVHEFVPVFLGFLPRDEFVERGDVENYAVVGDRENCRLQSRRWQDEVAPLHEVVAVAPRSAKAPHPAGAHASSPPAVGSCIDMLIGTARWHVSAGSILRPVGTICQCHLGSDPRNLSFISQCPSPGPHQVINIQTHRLMCEPK